MADEELLLKRLLDEDEEAFEELVTRHDGAPRRVARTFVRTASAADEACRGRELRFARSGA